MSDPRQVNLHHGHQGHHGYFFQRFSSNLTLEVRRKAPLIPSFYNKVISISTTVLLMEQINCQQILAIVMKIAKSKQARKFQIELGYFLLESFFYLSKLFIIAVFVVFVLIGSLVLLRPLGHKATRIIRVTKSMIKLPESSLQSCAVGPYYYLLLCVKLHCCI